MNCSLMVQYPKHKLKEGFYLDWTSTSVSKAEYFHLLSTLQMQNDCATIKALLPTLNQPIIILAMMPFLSLFCKSVAEYCTDQSLPFNIPNRSPFSIEITRAKLKLFDEKHGKSLRYIEAIDSIQDTLLRYRFVFSSQEEQNSTNNMAVIFDNSGKIISNTQFLFSIFHGKKPTLQDLKSKDIVEYGKTISLVIASVAQGFSTFLPEKTPPVKNTKFNFSYKDVNTNTEPLFSSSNNLTKSESLLLLHTLGTVNFARFIIGEIASADNPWRLRSQYISMYYAYKKILSIAEKTADETIKTELSICLLKTEKNLINPGFRNCMMHYSFTNKNSYLISDTHLSITKPFYGLVETCFDGMDTSELSKSVNSTLQIFSDSLTSLCKINSNGSIAI